MNNDMMMMTMFMMMAGGDNNSNMAQAVLSSSDQIDPAPRMMLAVNQVNEAEFDKDQIRRTAAREVVKLTTEKKISQDELENIAPTLHRWVQTAIEQGTVETSVLVARKSANGKP